MAHLVSNFLAASVNYYTYSKNSHTHPLDFYAEFAPGGMRALRTSYNHPATLVKDVVNMIVFGWSKPLIDLDTRSVVWSLSYFPTEVIERAFMKQPQATLPPDIVAKLTMSLASLEQALLDKDPMMPQHLRASHQLLISYPETVHLLDDDEVARLIEAAQTHANIEIVKAGTPRTGGRKKASADDL